MIPNQVFRASLLCSIGCRSVSHLTSQLRCRRQLCVFVLREALLAFEPGHESAKALTKHRENDAAEGARESRLEQLAPVLRDLAWVEHAATPGPKHDGVDRVIRGEDREHFSIRRRSAARASTTFSGPIAPRLGAGQLTMLSSRGAASGIPLSCRSSGTVGLWMMASV